MTTEDPFGKTPEHPAASHHTDSPPPPPPPPPSPGSPPPPQAAQPGQYAAQPGQFAAQPLNYGDPQYRQPERNPATAKNWMNITSLVLSLSSLLLGITAIGGIVFGHLGLAAAKRGEANNRGLGLAGVIIGYIFVVLGILAIVAFFAFFGWLATECGGDSPAAWCGPEDTTTWEWEVNP